MSTNRSKKHFTKHQIDTAILVARESKAVKNWVDSEAKFLGIDLKSAEGKDFYERHSIAAAKKLLGI